MSDDDNVEMLIGVPKSIVEYPLNHPLLLECASPSAKDFYQRMESLGYLFVGQVVEGFETRFLQEEHALEAIAAASESNNGKLFPPQIIEAINSSGLLGGLSDTAIEDVDRFLKSVEISKAEWFASQFEREHPHGPF